MVTVLAIVALLSAGPSGADLPGDQKAAATRGAIERLQQALGEWRALGERSREAETLHALALAHARLTKNREAFGFAEQAAAIRRELGDPIARVAGRPEVRIFELQDGGPVPTQ